jgi:hypothetical protein
MADKYNGGKGNHAYIAIIYLNKYNVYIFFEKRYNVFEKLADNRDTISERGNTL